LTTHRTQKCPSVWHAAADDSNQWVIYNVVQHFYLKKRSASLQEALCRCVTNRENWSWEKETTVENVPGNFTIDFNNNGSDGDSGSGSDTTDVESFISNFIPFQCR